MSSQTRPALVNRTNAKHHEEDEITEDSLIPLSERKRPLARTTVAEDKSARKRVRLQLNILKKTNGNEGDSSDDDDAPLAPRRQRIWTPLEIMNTRMAAGPSKMARLPTCKLSYSRGLGFFERLRCYVRFDTAIAPVICFLEQGGRVQGALHERRVVYDATIRVLLFTWLETW